MSWTVYIIECDDKSLYTGITTDLDRRFNEHRDSPRSARYFAGRTPVKVVFEESGYDRSSALKREYAIKQLSRPAKLSLIETTIKKGPDAFATRGKRIVS